MAGERGFEPPTPWSRTNNRCTNLLSRLGLFCVLYRLLHGIREPMDPPLEILDVPGGFPEPTPGKYDSEQGECESAAGARRHPKRRLVSAAGSLSRKESERLA
jgi:hypothetical protein